MPYAVQPPSAGTTALPDEMSNVGVICVVNSIDNIKAGHRFMIASINFKSTLVFLL